MKYYQVQTFPTHTEVWVNYTSYDGTVMERECLAVFYKDKNSEHAEALKTRLLTLDANAEDENFKGGE
jgi:hypothetical protein